MKHFQYGLGWRACACALLALLLVGCATEHHITDARHPAVAITPDELLLLHEQRARRILTVAAQNQAEVLILGAFGCGAFRNDPMVVAQAYKNILPEFLHHFLTIEFAVYCPPHDDSNYRAFKEMIRA